jgi:hypothetical protein
VWGIGVAALKQGGPLKRDTFQLLDACDKTDAVTFAADDRFYGENSLGTMRRHDPKSECVADTAHLVLQCWAF